MGHARGVLVAYRRHERGDVVSAPQMRVVTVPGSACTRELHERWKANPLAWLRNTQRHREGDDGYELFYYGECRACMSTLSLPLGKSRAPNADYDAVMAEDTSLGMELIR